MKFITVRRQGEQESGARRIAVSDGGSLLDALRENHLFLPACCGGAGICKKCAVRVERGFLPVTAEDAAAFSEEELQKGMRLSCRAAVKEDLVLSVPVQEGACLAVGSGTLRRVAMGGESVRPQKEYGIAVDIGTTTLAFALLDLSSGAIADSCTAANSQRAFGADVISRIQASNGGKKDRLRHMIRADIKSGIEGLIERNLDESCTVSHIAIAANTVMLHLLRGYSCEGLGRYPFEAKTLSLEELSFAEAFGEPKDARAVNAKVTLLPGISAFIGADVAAGLFACDILDGGDHALFLDLGTNGEMAVCANGRIYAASAAAGPAFEGGNISCGIASVPGAVCHVRLDGGACEAVTVAGLAPAGICGTGVIEAVSELVRNGLIDATGKLADPYFPDGFPFARNARGEQMLLTQRDVREVQMAKAAVRAGMEVLLERAGLRAADVGNVFLAGGFGYYLDAGKAAGIGLLPEELAGRARAMGNTALAGALRYLAGRGPNMLQEIIARTTEIALAGDDAFQERYYEWMAF